MRQPPPLSSLLLRAAWFALGWLAITCSGQVPTPPQVIEVRPEPGTTVEELHLVEVRFDAPVNGVDAADLWIGDRPASSVTETAPGHFLFAFDPPSPGPVIFRWHDPTGITHATDPSTPFPGGSWKLTYDPLLARRHLSISEFMADNDLALYDDDCDRSDWIEIHNRGTSPVDLLDWSLTDDATQPGKWKFPAYTLEPNAYLIVFASQKNKTNLPPRACRTRPNSAVGFHTNFRLSPEGEYLGLVAPDGQVVSEFAPAYPPQRRDVSYGRDPASPELVGYFTQPTPKAPNAVTGAGFTPEVRFSRAGTSFVDPFLLQLSCVDPAAVIRYTLDGTLPVETSAALRTYSGPFAITNTVQVRARAFRSGLLPGSPTSETYLRLTNQPIQLASFTSSLPVVVITTLKNVSIGASANTSVHFSLFEPRDGRASLLDRPTLSTRAGIKTRGSSTGGQPQSNFAIEWWDEFNQDRDLPVLGMPEDSEWVLYAPNEFDAALIHNPFTMELSRQMPFAAPQTRFVEVYLNKGGLVRSNDWFGLYVLMQKPGLAKGRIDLPKARPEDTTPPEVTGSYLFKTDRLDPGDSGFSAGGAQNAYVEPKEREMRAPQRAPQLAYLSQYFRDLDSALRTTNPNFRDPIRGYRGYIELTNWVDFHMLETLSGQVDAIRLSTYFYKPREGKLHYGPRWDYDRAWESKADDRDNNPRVWDSGGGLFGAPWWNRVLADRDAWQLWIDRWQHHRQSTFSQSNMFALIDTLTNRIGFVQPREARRWPATAPRASYRNEIGIMKTWISNRLAWIDGQLAQPPRLSSPGGPVPAGFQLTLHPPASVSAPANAAIFYTLDGSDPRPVGGTSNPIAFRYSAPITLRTNTRVIARVRDTGRTQRGTPTTSTWSSPAVATFTTTASPLVVSELMYHPARPDPSSPYPDADFEFLELHNPSTTALDLTGYHFTAGISFLFSPTNAARILPPGQRLLLVAHREAFLSRYPALASAIAGQFEGNLSNDGERLTLAGPAGEIIFDFLYPADRHPATDGPGFSLVLRDEAITPERLTDPAVWRVSSRPLGSPGTLDPAPGSPPPQVRINEFLPAPEPGQREWIELHNPEAFEVDVGGWWLSDSLDQPRRSRIPGPARIPPGGYLMLDESAFEPSAASPDGFRLSADGEELWLFSADPTGELTGWQHGFAFGAADRGQSFERALTRDGTEHWVLQPSPSPARPNPTPAPGSIVFSEIAPARTSAGIALGLRDGFLELANLAPSSLPLFDPAQPHRTWRIRGDLEFDFPAGFTLASGERVLVTAFDPELDPYELAAFRARYALADSRRTLGPWRGILPEIHPGPNLRLLRPRPLDSTNGDPEADLVVEESWLAGHPAWPTFGASSTPRSLARRLNPAGWAADPLEWAPTEPTPGEPDDDLDGLPDAWERAVGILAEGGTADSDPDGDGARHAVEHRNGTDPHDPQDRLRLRWFRSGFLSFTGLFEAPPESVFLLETPADNTLRTWTTLQTLTVSTTGTAVFRVENLSPNSRLFRIRPR